jgi:3-hydroxybutyryl-CoA dehydratase
VVRDHVEPVEVSLGGWKVTESSVREYLRAAGDTLPAYFQHGLTPPLALAARALGALLQHLDLPPGAIHSLQETETLKPVHFGQDITGTARLDPVKRRGGMEFLTAGFTLKDEAGQDVLGGKTTVLVVDPASFPPGERETTERSAPSRPNGPAAAGEEISGEGILNSVAKTITQEQLNAYAGASGDHNPLHLDPEFAATTQYGGVIAHGMLTLAFISEMMTEAFGRAWLQNGSLRVRFKGAAYLGDQVETRGRVTKEATLSQGRQVGCSVGLSNSKSGQELISGTATVVMPS